MLSKIFSAEALLIWRKQLLSQGGSSADLDWLLDVGGGLRWTVLQKLHLDPRGSVELEVSLDQLEKLWWKYQIDHIPLQYLIGRCPWRDFELEVSSSALIPRQETELLVDLALDKLPKDFLGPWVDLGTGSGALAVALARSFPNAIGHAVDCSKEALTLAERNLKRLAPGNKVCTHLGSWWEPLRPWWGSIALAVANPPYIPAKLIDELHPTIREHEPLLALCGGADGLTSCRQIINGAINALGEKGLLILEHHHDQSDLVVELMASSGFADLEVSKDLAGIKRFAMGLRC